jgi:hypothetical protein
MNNHYRIYFLFFKKHQQRAILAIVETSIKLAEKLLLLWAVLQKKNTCKYCPGECLNDQTELS